MTGYKPVVKKEKTAVVIITNEEKIEGDLFTIPNTRLMDMLNNQDEGFIAVANAKVYSNTSGNIKFESEFLMLNKSQIVFIMEDYRIPY